jgi:hypothetical protein
MVKEEGLTVYRASRMFNVPERTLRDRFIGRVDPELCVMGKLPLLDQFEEAKLVNHFKRMADLGYGYTQQECIDVASEFAVQLGKRTKDKPLSMKWMKGFLKRWPEMRVTKPRALEFVRAKMASEGVVMTYFDNLETCLQKNDLLDKPHLIYNVDEKGVSILHKPPHIVAGTNHPAQAVTSGKGDTVTIIGAGSASGSAIPPYFVFPGKKMNYDLLKGSSAGASGTVSDSGWSNMDVFRKYLTEHFIQFVPGRGDQKVLLLLDGHRSHVALTLAEWAKDNNVILYILPAHTSHILQPLDVGCYGPFQRMYHVQLHKYIRQTHAAITKYSIAEISCKVYNRALCADNLQSSFRRTGIYPLDRTVVPKSSMVPAEVFHDSCDSQSSQATVEEGGIPLDVFQEKEQQLVKKKNESVRKPYRTVSKLVSGKELTSDNVINAIQQHEQVMKRPKKTTKSVPARLLKTTSKSCVIKKAPEQNFIVDSPKPGPSRMNVIPGTSSSDDDDDDDETCCACDRFQTEEQAACLSLTFVKWAQCDGIRNGMPCLHWTHLGYCTPVKVIRRGDAFYCPHCQKPEE